VSAPRPGWEGCGRQALDLVDEVLAARPRADGRKLTEATQRLCEYREGLIARVAAGGADARRDLEHLNAVLSIVAGVHFPLGGVPWKELEGARGWLADLTGRVDGGASQ